MMARILGAQSQLGAEIDSLADAVNFGVTPALVVYVTLLSKWPVGWAVVLLYAVCVVLRLARYNAQDDQIQPSYAKEYFVGMPAPAGAVSMIGLVGLKLQFHGEGWWTSLWFLAIWITGTSILMVSTIPMKNATLSANLSPTPNPFLAIQVQAYWISGPTPFRAKPYQLKIPFNEATQLAD